MNATVEIRYETLLDVVQQMPSSQLERLFADIRRLMESRHAEMKYRTEIVEATRRLESGAGQTYSLEELHELIEA